MRMKTGSVLFGKFANYQDTKLAVSVRIQGSCLPRSTG